MHERLGVVTAVLYLLVTPPVLHSFPIGPTSSRHYPWYGHDTTGLRLASTGSDVPSETSPENKAMAFLRKIGKVGGSTDFKNAIGVDEGTAGKAAGKWGQGKVNALV